MFHGKEYLDAVGRGGITYDDIVLIGSIDGAQLYRNKASDCWISIWVIGDLSPDNRYKKRRVIPNFFVSGPNKPNLVDSFDFLSIQHLSALQNEGLRIWDSSTNRVFTSRPYLLLETTDGPGMTYLNSLVGHTGAYGCRLYCSLKGRRKDNAPTYYPAMAKPHNYAVSGCDHPDVDTCTIAPRSEEEYAINLAYVLKSADATVGR